jgi:hypothetical protein
MYILHSHTTSEVTGRMHNSDTLGAWRIRTEWSALSCKAIAFAFMFPGERNCQPDWPLHCRHCRAKSTPVLIPKRGAGARGRQYQQHSLLRMHAVCRSMLWPLLSCAVGGHYRDSPHFDRYCKHIRVFVQNRSCTWRQPVMTVKTFFSVAVQ